MFTTTRTLCGTKRVGKAYKVHNNQDTLWDKKCWKLRVGKAYKTHNNQDTLWDKKWRKFEGRKGICCSEQVGHFVGQKVVEISGQERHTKFTTTKILCGTKSGGNLRLGKGYHGHNNQDTMWDKKWRKFESRKGICVHNNQDTLWDKKWRKFGVGMAYNIHNNQDTLWDKKWRKFESKNGI